MIPNDIVQLDYFWVVNCHCRSVDCCSCLTFSFHVVEMSRSFLIFFSLVMLVWQIQILCLTIKSTQERPYVSTTLALL